MRRKVNRILDCPGQQWKPRSPELVCSLTANFTSPHGTRCWLKHLVSLGELSPCQVLAEEGQVTAIIERRPLVFCWCSPQGQLKYYCLTADGWIRVWKHLPGKPRAVRPFTGYSTEFAALGLWTLKSQIKRALWEPLNPRRVLLFTFLGTITGLKPPGHIVFELKIDFILNIYFSSVACNVSLHGMQISGRNKWSSTVHKWHTMGFIEEAFEEDTHWASCSSENSVLKSFSMSQSLSCKRLQLGCLGPLGALSLKKKGTLICACVYVGDSPWIEP